MKNSTLSSHFGQSLLLQPFKRGFSIFLFLPILCINTYVFSQDAFKSNIEAFYNINIFDTLAHEKPIIHKDSVPQKDIFDVTKKVIPFIKSNSDSVKIRPGKILPSVFPAIGYTLVSGGLVSVTANLSVYTANPATTNLSVVQTGGEYSLKHQIITWFITDFWTEKNKINFVGDCRYYKYPSYTYGLGTNTSLSAADPVYYNCIKVYEEALRHIGSFYMGGGYNLDYHYKIKELGENSDFENYNQGAASTVSSGLIVHLMFDNRTNMNNPKNAFYLSLSYRYNSTLLGSNSNWQYILVKSMKYIKLPTKSRNVLALWSWNEFTWGGKVPYFDLPSNGWDTYGNTGRGYIQSRFRGRNMVYLESEYRFPFSKSGLFGGVVFVNCESESQWPSDKFSYLAPAAGTGLRIKMNKHSDVNLCVDYGVGIGGSRGFFFNLGEVF